MTSLMPLHRHIRFSTCHKFFPLPSVDARYFVTPDNKYSVSICDPRRVFSLPAHFSLLSTSSLLESEMAVADELKTSTWPLEKFLILTLVAYDNFFSLFPYFIPQNNFSSEAGFTNCKQKTLKKNEEVAINYFISVLIHVAQLYNRLNPLGGWGEHSDGAVIKAKWDFTPFWNSLFAKLAIKVKGEVIAV